MDPRETEGGTQKPHPRNVITLRGLSVLRSWWYSWLYFGVFLLFLEIPLDIHPTPDHDAPGWPRRRILIMILIAITPAAALSAARSRPRPIARLGPITVTSHTHQHTTIHRHDRCCKRRPRMTTTHLEKHGGAFCSPSPSLPLPLLPFRSRVPCCGCIADYSHIHRTHTLPHHHTQT